MPNPDSLPAIQLPTGGQLFGFADLDQPLTECSAITNLQTQLAVLIASMNCQLKTLRLLKPLIEVISGLPNPPVTALVEFGKAAEALAPCLSLALSPNIAYVKNILCVEIKSLDCLANRLQQVAALSGTGMNPYSTSQVQAILGSYAAVVNILELAGELFASAGLNVPVAPILGGGTDPGSLSADQSAIAAFTATLQALADALGGC